MVPPYTTGEHEQLQRNKKVCPISQSYPKNKGTYLCERTEIGRLLIGYRHTNDKDSISRQTINNPSSTRRHHFWFDTAVIPYLYSRPYSLVLTAGNIDDRSWPALASHRLGHRLYSHRGKEFSEKLLPKIRAKKLHTETKYLLFVKKNPRTQQILSSKRGRSDGQTYLTPI